MSQAVPRSRLLIGVIAGTTLFALATTATAQIPQAVQPSPTAPDAVVVEPEAFNLTPYVGLGFAGDLENAPGTFGAALAYGLSARWGVEADLFFAPGGEQGVITPFDTSIWGLSGSLLYHFLRESEDFTPYAAIGLGILTGNSSADDILPLVDDNSTVPAWNFGAGIKTAMNERWGLRGDFRYFNGDDFAPDHWRLYGGVTLRRIGR